MNKETNKFLQKMGEFTKIALSEIASLKSQLSYHMTKQASEDDKQSKYSVAVIKVADALYESDLDLMIGNFDRREFIKRAASDPTYLAQTLEKVCKAADVSSIGKPARVATRVKAANYDPVYAKTFGSSKQNFIEFEELE